MRKVKYLFMNLMYYLYTFLIRIMEKQQNTKNLDDLELSASANLKIMSAANDKDIEELFGKNIKDMSFKSLKIDGESNSMSLVDGGEEIFPTIEASCSFGGNDTMKQMENLLKGEVDLNSTEVIKEVMGFNMSIKQTEAEGGDLNNQTGETFFHNQQYKEVKKQQEDENEFDDDLMRGTSQDLENMQNEMLEDLEIKHLNSYSKK